MEATCPDTTVWQKYCDGSIAADERLTAESHLVSCGRCRQQLISLFDIAREAQVEAVPSSLKNRVLRVSLKKERRSFFASFRPFAPVALAAVVVLAVAIPIFLYRDRSTTRTTTDLRQSDPAAAAISLANPANGANVDAGAIEFRWQDSSANALYEFTLMDEKGDIAFQERNAKSPVRLDTESLKLSPQRRYYWSVTARLPDGTRRESSVAFFTIK